MNDDDTEGHKEYQCAMPFWIDTDAYTDRDREMFVCGYEFHSIYNNLRDGLPVSQPIHRENESRVRMMCGKLGVHCTITQDDKYGDWSHLEVVDHD